MSLDRNDWEVINWLFVLPVLFYLNILKYTKLRKYYDFGTKSSRRGWHVIPAQEVNRVMFHEAFFWSNSTSVRFFKDRTESFLQTLVSLFITIYQIVDNCSQIFFHRLLARKLRRLIPCERGLYLSSMKHYYHKRKPNKIGGINLIVDRIAARAIFLRRTAVQPAFRTIVSSSITVPLLLPFLQGIFWYFPLGSSYLENIRRVPRRYNPWQEKFSVKT